MQAGLKSIGFMTASRPRPQPEGVSLPFFIATLLREASDNLPGKAAYVSQSGTEFVVCGDDEEVTNYRKVAEVAEAIAVASLEQEGPYISGRYVPIDEAPESGWVLAFRR